MTTTSVGSGPTASQTAMAASQLETLTLAETDRYIVQFEKSYTYNRNWYVFLASVQVVAAALVPFFATFNWAQSKYACAAMGVLIAVARGAEAFSGVHDNWVRHARTYKLLSAERELYAARAGDYAQSTNPQRLLAERTATIVLHENAEWVQLAEHASTPKDGSADSTTDGTGESEHSP